MDNGLEMTSYDFIDWAQHRGITLNHIESGELIQTAIPETDFLLDRTAYGRELPLQSRN